jgi:hypothetical protein
MTEAELEYKQYEEQERVIAYGFWESACLQAGGHIFISNPTRRCTRVNDCIPDPIDWSHKRRINHVQCVK